MTESERLKQLEDRLWKAADELRANSSLAASQDSLPELGLIFLRYADVRFTQLETTLDSHASRCGFVTAALHPGFAWSEDRVGTPGSTRWRRYQ